MRQFEVPVVEVVLFRTDEVLNTRNGTYLESGDLNAINTIEDFS